MIYINYLDRTYKNKYSIFKINKLNKKYVKKELLDSDYILSNICGYSLDKEQRIAVITDECSNLIIAGAGSGKSLTIIGKIRYLIERKNIKEEEILCITFTRDAALNLENNIIKNYGYNIKVYTFHKLALEILNSNYRVCDNDLLEYVVDEYFYLGLYNREINLSIKTIIGKIDISYNRLLKLKETVELKKIIITFINLFKTNGYNLNYFLNIKKDKLLIRIIIDIYLMYEEELRSNNYIDFNDMIVLASKYVKENGIKNYKYIIVDEYQDTSYIRYLLLKEIINRTKAKIICVGDDYQSIYRFNGCNLDMFLNFKKYFGYTKILKISNTYRNSQELINVASKFIMKNKIQIIKKLKSAKHINKPIKIMYGDDLKKLLDKVLINHTKILILGRNNFDIEKYFKLDKHSCIYYNGTTIKYLTIHRSKGLEEECVVIINLKDDILGMPSKQTNSKILNYVNKNIDKYPYEEERRLFYVALTRSKSDVYLLVNPKKKSVFIKEIIKDSSKYIEYI